MSCNRVACSIFVALCLLCRYLRSEVPASALLSTPLTLAPSVNPFTGRSHSNIISKSQRENTNTLNSFEKIEVILANDRIYLRKDSGEGIEVFENPFNSSISVQQLLNIDEFEALKLKTSNGPRQISQADAIFGIYEVDGMNYMALVTQSDIAVELAGHEIREVKEITLVHIPTILHRQVPSKELQDSEKLITTTFNRHSFYYCTTGYDITRSYQYNCNILSQSSRLTSADWRKSDQRFFWNLNLVTSFHQFSDWIFPMTNAWVSTNAISVRNHALNLTLISRRSRLRQGPRYIKRGSDLFGEVANFAESEQLLEYKNTSNSETRHISSFVQIRGSVPIFWSQPKTWKLRPNIVTKGTLELHARALKSHLMDLYNGYILPYTSSTDQQPHAAVSPDVYFINLIDKSGGQGALGRWLYAAFQHVMTQSVSLLVGESVEAQSPLSETLSYAYDTKLGAVRSKKMSSSGDADLQPPLRVERHLGLQNENETTMEEFHARILQDEMSPHKVSSRKHSGGSSNKVIANIKSCLIWFDYHFKCKKGNLSSLKEIYRSLSRYFSSENCYFSDINQGRLQNGIVRTNCVDCLDRTNVVQTTVARWMLIRQLKDLKILGENEVDDDGLSLPDPACEDIFRSMWCDNGDNLSLLYAGTKALKRDVTRLGKRTRKGSIDDGINSMLRYYINNNIDAERQVGIDLLLGLSGNEAIKSYSLVESVMSNTTWEASNDKTVSTSKTNEHRKSAAQDLQSRNGKSKKSFMNTLVSEGSIEVPPVDAPSVTVDDDVKSKDIGTNRPSSHSGEGVCADIPGDADAALSSMWSDIDDLLNDFIVEAKDLLQ